MAEQGPALTEQTQAELWRKANVSECNKLAGTLKVHVGQRIRLSQVLSKECEFLPETEAIVGRIVLDPRERVQEGAVEHVCKYHPLAIYARFVEEHDRDAKPSLGGFMAWAINDKGSKVYSMRMPGVFRLIGDAGLQEYLDLVEHFERVDSPSWSTAGGGSTA